ncbi:hypothetical protein I3J27_35010 [Bradyrhizobium xenonodulans]|uniref:Uncharacterized protein n=1 Tax=Bradyrhizobium xenonodulans TaxID=2736875 RepID=A0ABY7MMF0_9BRAD|nr:hypothetical protein [Bradyrhizobium xenonodulans]WBL78100.1 hypothetical protein I3J27_35010 [Bradyrhizobium xenonodulans]
MDKSLIETILARLDANPPEDHTDVLDYPDAVIREELRAAGLRPEMPQALRELTGKSQGDPKPRGELHSHGRFGAAADSIARLFTTRWCLRLGFGIAGFALIVSTITMTVFSLQLRAEVAEMHWINQSLKPARSESLADVVGSVVRQQRDVTAELKNRQNEISEIALQIKTARASFADREGQIMFSPLAIQETQASGMKDRTLSLAHAMPSTSKAIEMPRLNRDVSLSIDLEKLGYMGSVRCSPLPTNTDKIRP